jgi:CubicO group peptidase (beta-lactamase class C family)
MRFLPLLALLLPGLAWAAPLTDAQKAEIDARVARVLVATDVPSASIAVVTDSQLAYAQAYGDQRRDGSPPSVERRYPIASISKQFTAAALLMLEADGKLSLDDPAGKYLPTLTGADRITLRQLLAHTSGYRDYWPQDYDFAAMSRPATPMDILNRWAKAPLDYEPGTQWQYSNTGYTAAGLIAEQVAKEPLFAYLQRQVFEPLGMDVLDTDRGLGPDDAAGTMRYALGPVRNTQPTAPDWLFATGQLAMTPTDLAKWNVARLTRSLMPPALWIAQETNAAPANAPGPYGLGVRLDDVDGRPRVRHDGALAGYLSVNRVYPKDGVAITVLTNAGFSNAPEAIADAIESIVFAAPDEAAQARALFDMLAAGRIDRSRFTANGNEYFTEQALADYASSLAPLGAPVAVTPQREKRLRGGLTVEVFNFKFKDRTLLAVLRAEPDTGKVEQFTIYPSGD